MPCISVQSSCVVISIGCSSSLECDAAYPQTFQPVKFALSGLRGEHCICRALSARVFVISPGLIEAEIRVVLRLPGDRMAVCEEQLQARRLEVVISARVDHRRSLCLRGGEPLSRVRKDLG